MTSANGSVLYQLSYQANWELVIVWIRNIPVEEYISFFRSSNV